MNGGIQVIAQLLGKEDGLVFQVDELAFRSGVALTGFFCKGGVLSPCLVSRLLCRSKKLRRVDGAQECIAQAIPGLGRFHVL